MSPDKLRAIAIYLPQFHPIPENDAWWGKGFTEWTNVAKARPLFEGHYQPHLPADLGFYDLRLPETRAAQAALAKEYGIYGFCYYHYWFNGRRILERPFQEVFESCEPDFPFMLCWANENWTRVWDGGDKDLLLEQHYSAEDDLRHIQVLIPYFKDPRYIKIDGKPVIAIYRSTLLPDVGSTITIWRAEAAKHGMELYITRFESCQIGGAKYLEGGFDAAIDLQPWSREMNRYREERNQLLFNTVSYRAEQFFYRRIVKYILPKKFAAHRLKMHDILYNGYQLDYGDYVDWLLRQKDADYKVFPGITTMWDNSARRKQSPGILLNATPALYRKWLRNIVRTFQPFSREENFVFINAWNEWAEGCHLEPCRKWGRVYLEITKEVLEGNNEQ